MNERELIAMARNVANACDASHRECGNCGHAKILDFARYTIQELIKALEAKGGGQ